MAVEVKVAPDNQLELKSVFLEDRRVTSQYFNLTELPDTFTGGKNAFLIAGTDYLEPDTEVLVQIRDASGRIVYTESSDGSPEYYEGLSKVVAVYVYPTDSVEQAIDSTAFGPCTITILGQLKFYDNNGSKTEVPEIFKGKFNIRYVGQANINPNLANTTRVRFFRRPQVRITELLKPIFNVSGSAITASAIIASYADIKISRLETFAGDVKRVKVYRSSVGTVSDFELIQDIQIEAKELLQTLNASGSVVTDTGFFNSEVISKFWNSGSLSSATLNTSQFSGSIAVKLAGAGNFKHIPSLDLSDITVYELALDGFYTGSSQSNLEVYISGSQNGNVKVATINGLFPTFNFTNYTTQFSLPKSEPTASLYFKQAQSSWFLKDISLRASSETVFSPNEVSFIISMPTNIANETFNFNFEFFDVNNNFIPVAVTGSQTFTGGNDLPSRLLTFESDRTAFRFSSGSFANPIFQQVGFKVTKQNLSGSVTYASAAFDSNGNYIVPNSYAGTYPGALTNAGDGGASLSIGNFTGSLSSVLIGSITYTASCDGLEEYETIYRFEDGENAPGLFVTTNTNQFIYKATDLTLNPSGQVITIEAKRKNLASVTTPLTVNSASGKPPITYVSTNSTNGVDTYTLAGSSYPFSTNETIYSISGSDQFGNEFSDAIKITPIKILDGLSVSLTNENATLPALSTGFVETSSFVLTSGSVIVKVGAENITRNVGLTTNNRFDIISATATDCVANTPLSADTYGITELTKDSGSLSLLVRYKDGSGDTTDVTKLVTYSKAKKAAPTVTATFSIDAQAITKTNTGIYSTASAFTISVNEGGSNYSYSTLGSINTYYVDTITGGTHISGTVTPTTPTTDSGTTTNVTITYKNSEGTFGSITKAHRVNVTSNGNDGNDGTDGTDGVDGAAGAVGGDGPGIVFRGPWSPIITYNSISQDSTRRDVVIYSETYYATKTNVNANLNKQPDTQTTFWESLGTGSFFVAAEMFISKESYVQNTINVGTNSSGNANITIAGGTTSPYISIGQATKGYDQNGAFIGSDGTTGRLSLKSATNSLSWDGTSLSINGTINVTGGNASTQTYASSLATNAFTDAKAITDGLANGTYSGGTFISSTSITSPVIAGNAGFISGLFRVGASPNSIVLDATTSTRKIYIGDGFYTGSTTGVYMDSTGKFSLGNKFSWDGSTLSVTGNIVVTGGNALVIGNAANDINNNSTTISGGKIEANTIDAAKISSLIFTGKDAIFDKGTIGGWTINSANIASKNNRLILDPSPQIRVNDTAGEGKLFIRSGALTDYTVTSNSTTANFSAVSLPSTITNSINSIIPGSGQSFSVTQAGSYNGTIYVDGFPDVAEMANSSWNGYLYVGLSYQISSNSDFTAVVSEGTITSKGVGNYTNNGNSTLLDLPAATIPITTTLVAGTYYSRLRWTVIHFSDTDVTIKGNSSGTASRILSLTVNIAEFTDEGLQLVRSSTEYFRVERDTLQGANNAYVKIGGILEVTGDVISLASDKRLKENIIPIDGALNKIDKINGVYFNYTDKAKEANPNFGDGRQVGLIAQEVQEVLPEVINFAPFDYGVNNQNISGENYLTLNYDKVVPLLLQAIKELKCELDDVKKLIK